MRQKVWRGLRSSIKAGPTPGSGRRCEQNGGECRGKNCGTDHVASRGRVANQVDDLTDSPDCQNGQQRYKQRAAPPAPVQLGSTDEE